MKLGTKDKSSDTKNPVKLPLFYKLAFVVSFVGVLCSTGLGFFLLSQSASRLKHSIWAHHRMLSDDLSKTLETSLQKAQDALDTIGRSLSNSSLRPETREQLAILLVSGIASIDHAIIYDAKGVWIDTIKETLAEEKMPVEFQVPNQIENALKERANKQESAIGDTVVWKEEIRNFLLVPIRVGGKVTGYIASYISLSPLQKRVNFLQENHLSSGGTLYVIDQNLKIIAHPDFEQALSLTPIQENTGVLRGVSKENIWHFQKQIEINSAENIPIVGTVRPLHTLPWVVVIEVPQEIAYQEIDTMKQFIYLSIAVSIFLALLFALLLAKQITAPIGHLVSFANDLSARRFHKRVSIHTFDELSLLGNAMNHTAKRLEESEKTLHKELAIRNDLGRYLPKQVVERIIQREQDVTLGGKRETISVLFADVVSFTPLAEKLSPEEVVSVLNHLFTILTEIVFRYEGTVDKFIGDCIMAFFGAPNKQVDHASRALNAAEDMIRWLEVGNANWKKQYDITLQLAIGIHSGEAVVGNVGSETRMAYTAIGDTVNVAARLEAIANPQQILLTQATKEAAGEQFDYSSLGSKTLLGRVDVVEIFELSL